MKSFKKLFISVIFLLSFAVLITSCSESFLQEDLVTSQNTGDYETEEGLDKLVTGMYRTLRFNFNYEWAYVTTNYGVDEFTVGGDRTKEMWNSYSANLNSLTGEIDVIWDNIYSNINAANIAIKNIPKFYQEGQTGDIRLGEAYFLRAYDYFRLVQQFGGVPIKLNPSETVELEFTRNTEEEVYAQIISDFTKADSLLSETPAQPGRITKGAAQHFLAKAYLFRASELYDDWNSSTKQEDLENAIKYADQVINSGHYRLADDFEELWAYREVNGANEQLSEIILAAQFSDNTSTQGRYGNQIHLYYPSVYQNIPGMQRDIPGGREFQRLRTTDYAIDVYDRVNDSRFWKSFKTVYSSNNPNAAPVWTPEYAPHPDSVGQPKFYGGEQAIRYIVNDAGDARYTPENINERAPHMFVRYFQGEQEDMTGSHGNFNPSRYVTLSKFADGSRESVNAQHGRRDGIIARLAETYLIAAEAYGRLEQYNQALPYINTIRDRAAYKDGEDRSHYVDGGASYINNSAANGAEFVSYSNENTYYESNNISETTANTLNGMHLNSVNEIFNSDEEFYDKLGAASQQDKFLHFILNERSRELMGELIRWPDLSRTKTLIVRASTFNNEAQPSEKDYLRPIPQSFLDAIQKEGRSLTQSEKEEMQNPGW